jgi:hypothetical protein
MSFPPNPININFLFEFTCVRYYIFYAKRFIIFFCQIRGKIIDFNKLVRKENVR